MIELHKEQTKISGEKLHIKNDKINRSGNQKFEKGDIFMIQ